MIRQYVETALRKARYEKLGGGTFYGEVPRLPGVLVHEGVPWQGLTPVRRLRPCMM